MASTSSATINRSMTAEPGKKPRPTSGPLLDWFYVHAGYMNEDDGEPVVWDVPRGIEIEV